MELKDKKTSQGIKPSNPCPFCGCLHTEILKPGESTSGGYQVQCVNCGARGPTGWSCDQGAAHGWNKGDSEHQRPRFLKITSDTRTDIIDALRENITPSLCNWPDISSVSNVIESIFPGESYGRPDEPHISVPLWEWVWKYAYHSALIGILRHSDNGITIDCPCCGAREVHAGDARREIGDTGKYSYTHIPFRGECGSEWEMVIESGKGAAACHINTIKECAISSYDGFVYFLEAVGLQRIKIGYSKDPEARLKSLQTGSPVPLVEIGRIPGDQQSETDLHQQFDHLRLDGEWFHAVKQLRDYIRGLQ